MPLPRQRPRLGSGSHCAAAVDAAVAGQDAVIIAVNTSGGVFKENPTYVSSGVALVIEAMKRHSVSRLVVVSALGTGDSRPLLGWFVRTVLKDGLLKLPSQEHERKEAVDRLLASDAELSAWYACPHQCVLISVSTHLLLLCNHHGMS